MNALEWYVQLNKPSFAPPPYVFSIVWYILYPLIILSFGYIFYLIITQKAPAKIGWPFGLNFFFNILFPTIQFGLHQNLIALIDIFLVTVTLIWAMIAAFKYSRVVVYMNIPYLIWIVLATILQTFIVMMN